MMPDDYAQRIAPRRPRPARGLPDGGSRVDARRSQPLKQRSARAAISRVVDEVIHALEDVELDRRAERRRAPPRSRARATTGTHAVGVGRAHVDRRALERARPAAAPCPAARRSRRCRAAARRSAAGWRSAYSAARHAPCENPPSTTRERSPSECSSASTAPSAELSHGSFSANGARNDAGHQLSVGRRRRDARDVVESPIRSASAEHVLGRRARARAAARRRRGRPRRTARAAATG